MNKLFIATTAAALGFLSSGASAASFFAGHSISAGGYCNSSSSSGPFATGNVLGYTNQDCIGGYTVALDTVAQTITLTNIPGTEFGDYRYSQLSITGITGLTITGLSTIQSDPLFTPLEFAPLVPTPQLSFTGSTISIVFDVLGDPEGQEFNFGNDGGQAIFSYTAVAGTVPEAATWTMMIAGFGLVGGAMRRKALVAA